MTYLGSKVTQDRFNRLCFGILWAFCAVVKYDFKVAQIISVDYHPDTRKNDHNSGPRLRHRAGLEDNNEDSKGEMNGDTYSPS